MLPDARGDPAPFTYDISPEESPSTAVVAAVAAVLGYRPVVSGPNGDAAPVLDPLYSVVDPDALDAMFGDGVGSSPLSGSVRFEYHDCEVTVLGDAAGRRPEGDGVVRVAPPKSAAE